MTRISRRSIVLAALLALLALSGTARAAIPSAANHDLLMLRTGNSPFYSLLTMSVTGGHAARQLQAGLFDRERHILYAATLKDQTHSVVEAIDAMTGRVLRTLTVDGFYTTQDGNYTPAALYGAAAGQSAPAVAPASVGTRSLPRRTVLGAIPVDTSETLSTLSFNGRWLALRDATPSQPASHIIVIDTRHMRVVSSIDLKGPFGLDAINSSGSLLYLLQVMIGQGSAAYQVRVYDVRQGRLEASPLRESPDDSSILRGTSWTRVWSPRGDWLFTLYVEPGRQGAFVHALGVETHRVHCIVLHDPGATAVQLASYTLAVAPDGSALYAVNPLLGRVIAVHGLPYGPRVPFNLGRRSSSPAHMLTGTAISPDGRTVFAATDHGVWAIDTRTLALHAAYLPDQPFASVALSRDGQRLYALEAGTDIIDALDAMSGHLLGSIGISGPTGTGTGAGATAIERVMSD